MRFAALIYKITHFTLYIRYFNIYFLHDNSGHGIILQSRGRCEKEFI